MELLALLLAGLQHRYTMFENYRLSRALSGKVAAPSEKLAAPKREKRRRVALQLCEGAANTAGEKWLTAFSDTRSACKQLLLVFFALSRAEAFVPYLDSSMYTGFSFLPPHSTYFLCSVAVSREIGAKIG